MLCQKITLFLVFITILPISLLCSQKQTMPGTQINTVAFNTATGRLDKNKAIEQFKKEIAMIASQENKKVPQKNDSIFRVVSYNVHFWKNPEDTVNNMNLMGDVIESINPDLIVLQEVSGEPGFSVGRIFENSSAQNGLRNLNFTHFAGCNTVYHKWFGNIIASKFPFIKRGRYYFTEQHHRTEQRCNVFVKLQMPNNEGLSAYGTHLEVKGGESIRTAQIQQIAQYVTNNLKNKNALVAGDFNATRNSNTIKSLEKLGFKDCFTRMGWKHPQFTNWTGKEIDFIFLSPDWNLPLAGCYVWYDAASDHLPIIMDIDIKPQVKNQNEHQSCSIGLKELLTF